MKIAVYMGSQIYIFVPCLAIGPVRLMNLLPAQPCLCLAVGQTNANGRL